MPPEPDPVAALWAEVRPNQVQVARELVDDARTCAGDPSDVAAWARVRANAHRLAGSLGSFGQAVAGDVAVSLDDLVNGIEHPDADIATRAQHLAEAVLAALDGT